MHELQGTCLTTCLCWLLPKPWTARSLLTVSTLPLVANRRLIDGMLLLQTTL